MSDGARGEAVDPSVGGSTAGGGSTTGASSTAGSMTAGENTFLQTGLQSWPGEYFWIGLNEVAREDQWEWVDGTPMGYEAFDPQELNDANGDQDCGFMLADDGQWYDMHCNNDSPAVDATGWICEDPSP